MKKQNVAIFASGSGSNAKNLIAFFKDHDTVSINTVVSNKLDAPIVQWCQQNETPIVVFSNEEVSSGKFLIDFCEKLEIDYIILAGYLKKIPTELILQYDRKIINIHPSLLPKFGGKGMYGVHVHQAVHEAKEQQSGITIHFVNQNFDEGQHIAQFFTEIEPTDSVETIQQKIHTLEHTYFPLVVEKVILN